MDQARSEGTNVIRRTPMNVGERDQIGEMLRKRYGIDSEFVRVASLSKVLGIAQPTIYSQMRSGTFFLPYRRLSSMPAVKFDDLVDWYCSNQEVEAKAEEPEAAFEDSQAKAYSDALVASALAKMNRSKRPSMKA